MIDVPDKASPVVSGAVGNVDDMRVGAGRERRPTGSTEAPENCTIC